jgi:hypothetical protein
MISHTGIRQDAEGRYCLNDLHNASGGAARHKPSEWMRNKQAKALLAELESEAGIPASPVSSKKDGPYELRGTFIAKELVYAYAMWINPAFHLKVIRAYDAMVTGGIKERDQRLAKVERAYFERYPLRRTIRALALKGEPYWYIATAVGCAVGTVGNAVRHMIAWGLMETGLLAAVRSGMAPWWAYRRKHRQQLGLGF